MGKLKTLNEIRLLDECLEGDNAYVGETDCNKGDCIHEAKHQLRQKAINDIKRLHQIKSYKEFQPNAVGCCTNYPLCSMGGGFLECGGDKEGIEPIIRYIMWKNNLTEEDLK